MFVNHVLVSAASKGGNGSLVRRVTSPNGQWSEKSLWTAWNSKFETLDILPGTPASWSSSL